MKITVRLLQELCWVQAAATAEWLRRRAGAA